MNREWTERPETGAVWHFGAKCLGRCTPILVAVDKDLWLEFFTETNVVAVEPWDSMLMHWPGKQRGEPR